MQSDHRLMAAVHHLADSCGPDAVTHQAVSRALSAPVRPVDSWQDHAACKGCTALFFPQRTKRVSWETRSADLTAARAICRECPVVVDCFIASMRAPMEQHGIWAGLDIQDRRRINRKQRERQAERVSLRRGILEARRAT